MVVPNSGCRKGKGVEDLGSRNLVHDKDKATSLILVGPIVKPFRGEERVLCGLYEPQGARVRG